MKISKINSTGSSDLRFFNRPYWAVHVRRGFTLIELVIAGLVGALILSAVAMGMSQLGKTKDISKRRFDAHLRCDAALNHLRSDIVSVTRHSDLFWTRLLLEDDIVSSPIGDLDRDELLIFNTRLKPISNDLDYQGEGIEYEVQYRIEDDDAGPVLWQRRDMMPDEYPAGGGVITPIAEGVVGIKIEAFDGFGWEDQWDSDERGMPFALRITVSSSGHRDIEDLWEAPVVSMRTVVSIDRVPLPIDLYDLDELNAEDDAENVNEADTTGTDGNNTPTTPDTGGIDADGNIDIPDSDETLTVPPPR